MSAVIGAGMLAGTVVMSAWGGGRRKIVTLLGAGFLGGALLAAVALHPSLAWITATVTASMFMMPFMNAASQSIWQAKVAPELQGRVFSVRRSIAWSSGAIAPLAAGPLADFVFKPAMRQGGTLAGLFGPLVGVGTGRGVPLMFFLAGLVTALVSIAGAFWPTLRNVEKNLPDFQAPHDT